MGKVLYFISIFICVITLSFMMTSCDNESTDGQEAFDSSAVKIGVLLYRFDDQFIDSLKSEMSIKAREIEMNAQVDVKFYFEDASNQQDIQYDQLSSFIEQDYDALAVNLVDRSEAAKVIDLAKEANIPIVFFNRQPVEEDMARWNRIYYVGTEGEEAGIIQGDIIAEYIRKNPEVDKNEDGIIQYVMLQGQLGHQDAVLRTKHSIKFLEDEGFKLQELASDTANWQRSDARVMMANWLNIFGEEIEFIISNNDAMAIGAIDAMKEMEIPLIPVVGVDAIDIALLALENKEMVGTVLNDANAQGKNVIEIAYHLAIDEDPSDYIDEIEFNKYLWVPYKKILSGE